MPLNAISMHRAKSRAVMPWPSTSRCLRQTRSIVAANCVGIAGGIFLIEVAGLREMFGEQLLDMGRAVEWGDQLAEPRGDFGDEYVGKVAAGLFRGVRGCDFGSKRIRVQPFDDGAEQRFLGFEMMVERLPRQTGSLGCLLDRRAPKSLPAEHQHRGVENAVTGLHLTILTK